MGATSAGSHTHVRETAGRISSRREPAGWTPAANRLPKRPSGSGATTGSRFAARAFAGADLSDAKLQGVRLDFAQLQGASLTGTAFHGVDSRSGSDPHEPVTQIRNRAGRKSDLSNVVFSGGVTDENVEALTSDLSNEWATQLRARLAPHVGEQPSSRPPDGATTGAYAEAQAKNWIAEYEEAVAAPHRGAARTGGSR